MSVKHFEHAGSKSMNSCARLAGGVLTAMLLVSSSAKADFEFDDVQVWVGSGENEALLVIDWNDGIRPQSMAWGYRWDGEASAEDMLIAVCSADLGLYGKISTSGEFGIAAYGLGYDLDHDGFALSDDTMFDDGLVVTGPSDGATSVDPDDHYQEGWFVAGFWSNWRSADGVMWDFSSSDQLLADGDWDGWSWAPNFKAEPPSEPVAAGCPGEGCQADLTHDCAVDLADLGLLLTAYQTSDAGDTDGDGDTDLADLGALLAEFGTDCH